MSGEEGSASWLVAGRCPDQARGYPIRGSNAGSLLTFSVIRFRIMDRVLCPDICRYVLTCLANSGSSVPTSGERGRPGYRDDHLETTSLFKSSSNPDPRQR